MPEPDLDAIRARCDAATPGPWAWEPPKDEGFPTCDQSLVSEENGEHVLVGWGYDASGTECSDQDRAFIAHARTDVPALVAEVERLRGALVTGESSYTHLATALEEAEAERDRLRALYTAAVEHGPFPCCEHCADDPGWHADNPPDTHETSCSTCDAELRGRAAGDADTVHLLRRAQYDAWKAGEAAGEEFERDRWRWSAGTLTRTMYGLTEYPERPVNPYGTRAKPDSAV